MLYSTVEIKPKAFREPGWIVSFYDLEHDREDENTQPNALGFYHYPRHIGKQAAFEKLRQYMIRSHEERIALLTESVNSLKALEAPK